MNTWARTPTHLPAERKRVSASGMFEDLVLARNDVYELLNEGW